MLGRSQKCLDNDLFGTTGNPERHQDMHARFGETATGNSAVNSSNPSSAVENASCRNTCGLYLVLGYVAAMMDGSADADSSVGYRYRGGETDDDAEPTD